MIFIIKQGLDLGYKSIKQPTLRKYLISGNSLARVGYFSKINCRSLGYQLHDQYSSIQEGQGCEDLRSYISQLQSKKKKLSKQNYLIFKKNIKSIESIDLLIQYLEPIVQNLQSINQKRQKRIFKLIIQAEKNLLSATETDFSHTGKTLIKQQQITQRISAINKFMSDSAQNMSTLLNKKIANPSTIESFYALKQTLCKYELKRLSRQQIVLSSFQTLTYLAAPTLFYFVPYSSLLFLHPYVGEIYYRFALLSLRQNQKTGIFISLLLAGSLSLAFYKTYSDIYDIYRKKILP